MRTQAIDNVLRRIEIKLIELLQDIQFIIAVRLDSLVHLAVKITNQCQVTDSVIYCKFECQFIHLNTHIQSKPKIVMLVREVHSLHNLFSYICYKILKCILM
jgi:hypothetical protein